MSAFLLSRYGGVQRVFRSSYRCGTSLRVLLLQHLDTHGKPGEIVSVKRGYARNFLIPRKIAVYATEENKSRHKSMLAEGVKFRSVTPLAEEGTNKMTIRKYTNESGSLAGIVTKFEIKTFFERQGIHVGVINISSPIRTVGTHLVQIDGFPVTINVEGFR
jgi:large subunit ribosomal protein L9